MKHPDLRTYKAIPSATFYKAGPLVNLKKLIIVFSPHKMFNKS